MARMLLLLCLLLALVGGGALAAPAAPTALRVVDVRWIEGQPELETWLGSLQGALNRRADQVPVFMLRTATDAEWVHTLVRTYGLKTETFTPKSFLDVIKPVIKGQILYDPAKPWSRNAALTAAACTEELRIVTDTDLGLPTTLDLRTRWTNRRDAYAWARETYGKQVAPESCVFAPESGHLLADMIVARKLLAVDYAPTEAEETTTLKALLKEYPAGSRLYGEPDDRCGNLETALWQLTALLHEGGQRLVPVRMTANLSCYARFPVTRPLQPWLEEATPKDGDNTLVIIYDAGSPLFDGSQSLDAGVNFLFGLLGDPALADLPVGLQVPLPLIDEAPAVYQALVARQRFTAAEFVAAPNGNGWALPMLVADPTPYLAESGAQAQRMGIQVSTLHDVGGKEGYERAQQGLAQAGFRGICVHPLATASIADKQPRIDAVYPGCAVLVSEARVSTPAELRAALKSMKRPFQILYADPFGLPPATLRAMLPEIAETRSVLAPSQALRAMEESASVMPFLLAKLAARPKAIPKRDPAKLRVGKPTTSLANPTTADAIPISVTAQGSNVLVARLIVTTPHGRVGTVDLRLSDGAWKATLPPLLIGGETTIRARFVDKTGFGVALSEPLILTLPIVDGDRDGAEDTLEAYQMSDPANPDTDEDGLPDGLDPQPLRPDRAISSYGLPIDPPCEGAILTEAGKSTTEEGCRLMPANESVTYTLPLAEIPAPGTVLRLITVGPGTVALNGGAPATLEARKDTLMTTVLPLGADLRKGGTLTVKLTAGAEPLRLCSLRLTANPEGPYILPITLTPAHPPAGMPITVSVTVYDPDGVKAVRARYGTSLTALQSVELKPVEGGGGVIFTGEIPAQQSGNMLLYGVEAEDDKGNRSASPWLLEPVGHTRKHTLPFHSTREFKGAWENRPLWGRYGRALLDGAGIDKAEARLRPGTYYVWIQGAPRQRGLAVAVFTNNLLGSPSKTLLSATVPAGSADGWVKLGNFRNDEDLKLVNITVTPVGAKGFCAYGMLVLTQDAAFNPPVATAPLDWYNSITIRGLKDGQVITGDAITCTLFLTGNIDDVHLAATSVNDSTKEYPFAKQRDGSYALSTRILPAGEYKITGAGYKRASKNNQTGIIVLVSATLKVIVQH